MEFALVVPICLNGMVLWDRDIIHIPHISGSDQYLYHVHSRINCNL
jgi:hypothetical protein